MFPLCLIIEKGPKGWKLLGYLRPIKNCLSVKNCLLRATVDSSYVLGKIFFSNCKLSGGFRRNIGGLPRGSGMSCPPMAGGG
ncbi:unnamed protein product [Cylicostephanus goldi]|uniref:Uncharacterized protein n=1 Tax=Cylicostephanus goldi TaxID=71465 RepID=A0A3P6Q2D6_CYLGO|nr:unnamed protein product [Cylicostephanus goldi]